MSHIFDQVKHLWSEDDEKGLTAMIKALDAMSDEACTPRFADRISDIQKWKNDWRVNELLKRKALQDVRALKPFCKSPRS